MITGESIEEIVLLHWINRKLDDDEKINSIVELQSGVAFLKLIMKLSNKSKQIVIVEKSDTTNIEILIDYFNNEHNSFKYKNNFKSFTTRDFTAFNKLKFIKLIWNFFWEFFLADDTGDDISDKKEFLLNWFNKNSNSNIDEFNVKYLNDIFFKTLITKFQPHWLVNNTDSVFNIAESHGIIKIRLAELSGNKDLITVYLNNWYEVLNSKKNNISLKIKIETFFFIINELTEMKFEFLNRFSKLSGLMNQLITKFEKISVININNVETAIEIYLDLINYKKDEKIKLFKEFNLLLNFKIKFNNYLNKFNLNNFFKFNEFFIKISNNFRTLTNYELILHKNSFNFLVHYLDTLNLNFKKIAKNISIGLNLIENDLLKIDYLINFESFNEILIDLESLKLMNQNLVKIKYEINSINSKLNFQINNGGYHDFNYNYYKIEEFKIKINFFHSIIIENLKFIDLNFNKIEKIKSIFNNSINFNNSMKNFELKLFKKFDTGSKNYLNKNEFRSLLKIIYPNLDDNKANEFFEIIYNLKKDKSMLRGITFDEFNLILQSDEFNIENENENNNNGNNNNGRYEKDNENQNNKDKHKNNKNLMNTSNEIDFLDITNNFHLKNFEKLTNGKPFLTLSDLHNINLDDFFVNKVNDYFEKYDDDCEKFNYKKFFTNPNESLLYNDLNYDKKEEGKTGRFKIDDILIDIEKLNLNI